MSGDLIRREAAMKAIRVIQAMAGWKYGIPEISIHNVLLNIPAVDAEPVRRGRWIDRGDYVTTAYGSLDIKVCSECRAEVTIDNYDYYCPNCGAKMDGDCNETD